ncbi:MAG: metal-transporting ATPase [Leptospiraceae bacterium]|nr:metal-transporting ATPase [Leptospiraceae bacterium]
MQQKPWHTQSVDELLTECNTNLVSGLSTDEASRTLQQIGPNRLDEQEKRPLWKRFLDQFRSFLTIVLIGAGLLAWAIGDVKDSIVILIVVVFNACLGFYQEYRAEATLDALKEMLIPSARVRRDGTVQEVRSETIVPGDIVLLEAGDQVPADGRVLRAVNLEIQEAALTGESMAVTKQESALENPDSPIAERSNMLYMNTMLVKGRAEMLVLATGMNTEMGRIAGLISEAEGVTPLQKQLDILGKRLALIAGAVVLLIFGLTLWRGAPWAEAAMTSVALAVASVPEGLPAVVTVTLAIGMWRMARKKAILKNLSSVETLGSTSVICTDKTGTLTMNEMTARAGWFGGESFEVTGEGYGSEGSISRDDLRDLLLPLALCNEARVQDGELVGDPTEGALFTLAQKGGIDATEEGRAHPRIAEIPFDAEYRYMATFHQKQIDNQVEMYIKGAPDAILDRCQWILYPGDPDTNAAPQSESTTKNPGAHVVDAKPEQQELTENLKRGIVQVNEKMAGDALRVLGVARRIIPAAEFDAESPEDWRSGWTFLGLVGLMDPPRPEARTAIENCQRAGIRVKMMTGDHSSTAAAIATELGLEGDVLSGAELEALSDDELNEKLDRVSVFARLSPEHKVRIVKKLKKKNYITAMTGDGVNDAPALKAADIGIAMGNGTAVTREAARLVLTDNNFVTIRDAVEEGRIIFDNIVKFVRFQLSTNIAAILTVLGSTLLGTPMPFSAIQLLWINIIMDGPPAMTLGIEPGREDLMTRPPRRSGQSILNANRLSRIVAYGVLMMIGTLSVLFYGLHVSPAYASTLAFTTFVFFQFFNVFNARAEFGTAFNRNFFRNGRLWFSLFTVLLLQVVAVEWPPAQESFATTGLTLEHWFLAAGVGSSVLVLDEVYKLLKFLLSGPSGAYGY